MIDDELAAFIESKVMIAVAGCDARSRASIGRSMGARLSPARDRIELFVSRAQWPALAATLTAGAPVAATFSRPSDYRTYQVKGRVLAAGTAYPEHDAFTRDYHDGMMQVLTELGVEPQIPGMMGRDDLVIVTIAPELVFLQTPGPAAGRLVARATS